ncbi:SH3 domain-containing protein [Novosphingobium sp. KN65.2]|uniref:SH3 domain-containing protein n=1 Tax=Novosphingobium sp. KN65.2 TaxID=1478134 RepID=UPI0005DF36DB|nr:SH3 domain-containing protein [Novosphingobium sp. KN65.2]CDO38498.1 conserved exported hypothetical protein [Novosphingobium sp. KN65.2]
MIRWKFLIPLAALCSMAVPAYAGDDDKVPYWASIDTDLANMRVGPGESYRIAWVYKRPHLPVKIVRREGPWRLIEDPDGDKGWMRDLLLSRQRSAIVVGEGLIEMHAEGKPGSPILWRVEPGVVGLLGNCESGWCAFDVEGHRGFVPGERLWGTGEP